MKIVKGKITCDCGAKGAKMLKHSGGKTKILCERCKKTVDVDSIRLFEALLDPQKFEGEEL